MAQLKTRFVLAEARENQRNIPIAALFAFAVILIGLPAGAQRLNGTGQNDGQTDQLFSARIKQQAGQYSAARDILLDALSKAPNSASLLDQLGSVEQDLGEYFEAEHSYLHALSVSAQSEDDLERLVIWNNLGTLYLDTNQYSKGEQVREQLGKLPLGALDNHPAEAGALLNTIACLEHARNRDDEAERYYLRCMLLLRQVHGPVSIDAALVEANIGFLQLEARQYESAAGLFRQAIREIEIASGPKNPGLIRPLVNLARCENMTGHADRAEPVARRAVELSVRVFGEEHPVTATAMLEQATALRRLRHKRPAHDLEKRAKACLRNNPTTNLSGYTISLRDLAGATTR